MVRSPFLDRGGQRAALPERREERSYVLDEQIGRLERGEMAAPLAVGLRSAAGGSIAGIAETSVGALAKLEQVLPSRLRHRIAMLTDVTVPLMPGGTAVDRERLLAVAAACRDHHRLRFDYRSHDGAVSLRATEPYKLVHTGRWWYLVAYDLDRADWRTFRLDRLVPRTPAGPRFVPREPPEDAATYVSRSVSSAPYRYRARVLMHAPASLVADVASPTASRVEPLDHATCVLTAGSNSLDELAIYIALKGVDFEVLEPPELAAHIATLAARLRRSAPR